MMVDIFAYEIVIVPSVQLPVVLVQPVAGGQPLVFGAVHTAQPPAKTRVHVCPVQVKSISGNDGKIHQQSPTFIML
jgi:hypothetical protein